ncbi:MAG: hypothetical protein ACFFD3_01250 [Candidatus Thorarchaeota archaeon]
MDTAKDGRVLILEDALRRLNEIVGNRKLKMHIDYNKLGESLKTAGSLLYEVKYSYTDSKALADLPATTQIVDAVADFGNVYHAAMKSGYKASTIKEALTFAEIEYSLRIASGFQERLRVFEDDPGLAVDIIVVEVTSVGPVEGSSNLKECRCTDGTRIWRIVTNIKDIKTDSKMICAVLPPVEMMNVVSEAMFLGGNPLPEETELGILKNPPSNALNQARAQVMEITKRMI